MKHIKKIVMAVTSLILISMLAACSNTSDQRAIEQDEQEVSVDEVVSTDVKDEDESTTDEGNVSEVNNTEKVDVAVVRKAFIDFLLTNPSLIEVKDYVSAHIEEGDEALADDMVTELIVRSDVAMWDEMDVLFLDENIGIHEYIYGIYELNADELGSGYVFMGKAKETLLDYVEDVDYKMILEDLFEKGYGIYSAEGAYYPVVDYLSYKNDYGQYIGQMTREYLDILSEVVLEPTTYEEYLAITPIELKDRAYVSEQFLITYPEAPLEFKTNIGRNLLTCLWKLSGPNIFDGMLNDDFTLSEPLKEAYDSVLEERSTPIVTSTVERMMAWIALDDDGVLGSLDDMDNLNSIASEIFNESLKQMETLYPMQ